GRAEGRGGSPGSSRGERSNTGTRNGNGNAEWGIPTGMSAASAPLGDEQYVSLETFRKDGTGVKTPVWAAALDGRLVVMTDGTSYKVKRLRNNPKVRVAPCDGRGKVRGEWLDGTGRVLADEGHVERAHQALRDKYGFMMAATDFFSRLFGRMRRRAYL